MNYVRLNAYHIMWLFVFFDLPTYTQKERKAASQFRIGLVKNGFTMMQYSVYIRHCASKESADAHFKRVRKMIPELGHVSIVSITEKQYGDIINFWGEKDTPLPGTPKQLTLF